MSARRVISTLGLGLALAGAAAMAGPPLLSPLVAGPDDAPAPPWHRAGLPRQSKPFTSFRIVTLDGRRVLKIESDRAYGNLVHALPLHPHEHRLSWRWRLDQPVSGADVRVKARDDSPLKVCAFFDEPIGALPFAERQMLRLARGMSDEPLPAATICYLWDNLLPPGTVVINAYTRRVRSIVLRGPEAGLQSWQLEQRDIDDDFLRLFGDEMTTLPPLMGIGVGADADSTPGHSLGYVGELALE